MSLSYASDCECYQVTMKDINDSLIEALEGLCYNACDKSLHKFASRSTKNHPRRHPYVWTKPIIPRASVISTCTRRRNVQYILYEREPQWWYRQRRSIWSMTDVIQDGQSSQHCIDVAWRSLLYDCFGTQVKSSLKSIAGRFDFNECWFRIGFQQMSTILTGEKHFTIMTHSACSKHTGW